MKPGTRIRTPYPSSAQTATQIVLLPSISRLIRRKRRFSTVPFRETFARCPDPWQARQLGTKRIVPAWLYKGDSSYDAFTGPLDPYPLSLQGTHPPAGGVSWA